MMKDLKSRLGVCPVAPPVDLVHTNTKSKIVDLQGWKGCAFLVTAGVATGGDGSNYATPKLQESDTTADADFTDVVSADYSEIPTGQGDVNTSNVPAKLTTAGETRLIGYIGAKRYVRCVLTYTGTGITAGLIGVVALVGRGDMVPVTTASSTQTQPTDGTPFLFAGTIVTAPITAT